MDHRVLLEYAPDAMVITDGDDVIVLVNAAAERLFGYTRDELLGRGAELVIPVRDDAASELRGRRKNGREVPIEVTFSHFETTGGTLVLSSIRDITRRTRTETNASHFAAVVASSHDAIFSLTLDGVICSWNAGAERLYGYSAEEAIGQPVSTLGAPGHDDEVPDLLQRAGTGEHVDEYETIRMRKDGAAVEVSLNISPIRDADGHVTGVSTIARDISARRRYQEQLRFLADHDSLTGARNRRQFERDLTEQLNRAHWYSERGALLIIDVDDFKQINDTRGHRAGDRALKLVAHALLRRLRATDLFARIGGDEFAVILPYASETQALAVCRGLRNAIGDDPIDVPGVGSVSLSISIGHAVIDEHTEHEEDLFNTAESRMYREKAAKHHCQARDQAPPRVLHLAGGTESGARVASLPTPSSPELPGDRQAVAALRRPKSAAAPAPDAPR